MNLAATALEDFAGVMSSGRPVDFQAAYGMMRLAASDPAGVSARTGQKLADSAQAEGFLMDEFLDMQSLAETDRAIRATTADVNDSDRDTNDVAFAYAGLSSDDVRKMQADAALGDNTAAVRLAQKFYFG